MNPLRPLRVVVFARGPYGREALSWLARREDVTIPIVFTEEPQRDSFIAAMQVARPYYPTDPISPFTHSVLYPDTTPGRTDVRLLCE